MDKRAIAILFILMLFLLPVFSQDEYIIGEGEGIDADKLKQAQETISSQTALSAKIDQMVQQNTENLETFAIFIHNDIQNLYSMLAVTVVVAILSGIGLWYAIFTYFKAKRVI